MSKYHHQRDELHCSFCGKAADEVDCIISGPEVYICDECIYSAREIIKNDKAMRVKMGSRKLPIPEEINSELAKFVVGQERAKKVLSVAVYNHYKRVNNLRFSDDDVEVEKSNILLVGPTGVGKTLLAQTLARILQVPFSIADATILTEAGYVGEDVENILVRLLQAADYDLEKAERGIVYIDEIDKIARKEGNPSITRDVSGEGVQQALLKMLEGTISGIPPRGGRKHPEQNLININTKNILFICGGAFGSLEKIIMKRLGKKVIGFGADVKKQDHDNIGDILAQVEPDDLLKYGLIPELIGRLHCSCALGELDEKSLLSILTEPKNAIIKQYKKLFELENIDLHFKQDALKCIVSLAIKRGTGARGLRSVMESFMIDIMFNLPSQKGVKEVIINKSVVLKKTEPQIIYHKIRKEA